MSAKAAADTDSAAAPSEDSRYIFSVLAGGGGTTRITSQTLATALRQRGFADCDELSKRMLVYAAERKDSSSSKAESQSDQGFVLSLPDFAALYRNKFD
eukprot:g285.t1